jgi:outer membrane receptor for ferrienterochelin and colicins
VVTKRKLAFIFQLSGLLVGLSLLARAELVSGNGAADPVVSAASPTVNPAEPASLAELPLELQVLNSDLIYVSSATKYLKKLSEVPGTVTVVTEQEIKEYGSVSLNEILDRVCGIQVVERNTYMYIELRGLFAPLGSKVLVLQNGRILNQNGLGFDPSDFIGNLDNIKQIEVIRGPGSALYGRDAYAGVINIITKDGRELNGLHTQAAVSHNEPDRVNDGASQYYNLAYGRHDGDWDYTVTGSYWRIFSLDIVDNHKRRPNNLYDGERGEFSLKYKDDLSLRGGYNRGQMPGPQFIGRQEYFYRETAFADLQYGLKLDDLSRLTVRAYDTYFPNEYALRYLPAPGAVTVHHINSIGDLPPGIVPGLPQLIYDNGRPTAPSEDAVGSNYILPSDFANLINILTLNFPLFPNTSEQGSKNQLVAESKYELSWPEHNYLLAGADYQFDWSNLAMFYTPTMSDANLAGYVQDEYHLGDDLIFLGGLRFDYNSEYASAFSPRVSAIYSPVAGLRFKGLYGTAYRAPNDMERGVNLTYGPLSIRGNPNLKPETIQQAEGSVEYESGNWLQAKGTFFYYQTHDEITYMADTTPYLVYDPAGPALYYISDLNYQAPGIRWDNNNSSQSRGFEIEGKLRPVDFVLLNCNYSRWYQSSENHLTIYGAPDGIHYLFNGELSFHFDNLVFLNFYESFHTFPTYPTYADMYADRSTNDWTALSDVTAGVKYQGWALTLGCYNVFQGRMFLNEREYLMRPRIYRADLEYAWNF